MSFTDALFSGQVASGSISGVSTRSVNRDTGIIGLTMSLGANHSNYIDNTSVLLGTSYQMQLQPDKNEWQQGNSDINLAAQASPTIVAASLSTNQGLPLDPGYLFDRVVVYPDPNSLANPIPKGRIFGLTLRKRKEADDRVVLNANQPSGSAGAQTLSGDGYLIPNDLTDIQQRNVQKIINKLKSENSFTQDSPDSLGS